MIPVNNFLDVVGTFCMLSKHTVNIFICAWFWITVWTHRIVIAAFFGHHFSQNIFESPIITPFGIFGASGISLILNYGDFFIMKPHWKGHWSPFLPATNAWRALKLPIFSWLIKAIYVRSSISLQTSYQWQKWPQIKKNQFSSCIHFCLRILCAFEKKFQCKTKTNKEDYLGFKNTACRLPTVLKKPTHCSQ